MRRTVLWLLSGILTFVVGIPITWRSANHGAITIPPTSIPIEVAENWRRVRTDHLSLSTPPAMQERVVQGRHGPIWLFDDSSTEISFEQGLYPDDLTFYVGQPSYKEEMVRVDGRDGKLCTFQLDDSLAAQFRGSGRYVTAAYFHDLRNGHGTRLTAWANCKDESAQETAKRVFLTLKFKP